MRNVRQTALGFAVFLIGLVATVSVDAASFGRAIIQGGNLQREVEDYEAQRREREQLQRMRQLEIQRQQQEIEYLRLLREQRAQEAERIRQQNDDLARQRAALEQQTAADRAARVAAEKQWQQDIADFMARHPQYRSDPVLFGALDATVKELAKRPENADKLGPWFLDTAHQVVQERFSPQPAIKKSLTF